MLRPIQDDAAKQCKGLRRLPVANPADIFPVRHILHLVLLVPDMPVLTHCSGGLFRVDGQSADVILRIPRTFPFVTATALYGYQAADARPRFLQLARQFCGERNRGSLLPTPLRLIMGCVLRQALPLILPFRLKLAAERPQPSGTC